MSIASTSGWAQTVQRLGMVWAQGFARLNRLRLKPAPVLAGQLRGGPLDASCLFDNKGAPRRPVLFLPSSAVASHRPYVARLENPDSFSLASEVLLDKLGELRAEDHELPRSWRIHPRTVSRNPSRWSRLYEISMSSSTSRGT